MKKRKNIWLLLVTVILLLVSETSCIYDKYDVTPDLVSEGDGVLLLDIDYGAEQGMGLLIETLDILSFYVSGSEELFLYRSPEVTLVEDNGSTKKYEASIAIYNGLKQRLVLIANARDQVDALGEIALRTPKESVLPLLKFEFEPRAIEDPDDDTDPVYIPMWGESGQIVIGRGVSVLSDKISMIRSVVRLDVRVNSSARSDFKLEEVYLYNADKTGRLVPAAVNYDEQSKKVTGATLPTPTERILTPPSAATTLSTNGISSDDYIYMVENAPVYSHSSDVLGSNPAVAATDSATCLIIGGNYKNEGRSYYRVDFRGEYGRYFRSLLRNSQYTVDITSVLGSGYSSPDEAFEKTWKEVNNKLIEWSETVIEWEDLDNKNWLKVSPGLFSFMYPGGSGELRISTDYDNFWGSYTEGWQGELKYVSGGSDWIEFKDNGGNTIGTTWSETGVADPDIESVYEFSVGDYYRGDPWFRHAVFTITAGNLKKYVDVYQTNETWANGSTGEIFDWSENRPTDVEFDGPYRLGVSRTAFELLKEDNTYSFWVSTDYEHGYEARVVTSDGGNWITIDSGGSISGAGDQELVFSLTHNQLTYDREAVIYITAGNLIKEVTIRQITWIGDGDGMGVEMDWTESNQSENELDGPYRIGVSQTLFELIKGNYTDTFKVSTNYKDGYDSWVETSDGGNWVTINSGGSSSVATDATLSFSASHNTDDETRHATIFVRAGNLIKEIHLRQNTWIGDGDGIDTDQEWSESDQSDTDLDGPYSIVVGSSDYAYSGESHSGQVIFTANGGGVWTAEVVSGNEWLSLSGTVTGAANGSSNTLNFSVTSNDSGGKREGYIRVHLVHNGNRIKKDIKITQYLDMVSVESVYPNGGNSYVTDQFERQYFLVKSRTAWEVEVEEDTSSILRTLHTTGGGANIDSVDEEEQKVYFVLNTIDSGGPYKLKFRVKSVSGAYQPVTVTIDAEP